MHVSPSIGRQLTQSSGPFAKEQHIPLPMKDSTMERLRDYLGFHDRSLEKELPRGGHSGIFRENIFPELPGKLIFRGRRDFPQRSGIQTILRNAPTADLFGESCLAG